MIYSPVIMTAYGRCDLLKNCINSLGLNTDAKYTELYIGLDYPKNDKDRDEYEKVLSFLSGEFTQFKKVHVIKRNKNYGAKKNLRNLIKMIQKISNTWIFIAEDEEFSPNYLSYMNSMLGKYEQDNSVVAVTGYSYPVAWKTKEGCNCVKQSLTANDWGIGFWKDKYNEMNHYFKHYGLQKDFKKNCLNGFQGLTDWAIKDYGAVTSGLLPYHSYLMEVYDTSVRIYLSIHNKYVIMPTVSKVRQLGFDGSGINCVESVFDETKEITSSNYDWKSQPIDLDETFMPKIDEMFDNDINRELLNMFDKVDNKELEVIKEKGKEFSSHGGWYRHYVNIKHVVKRI